MAKLRTYRPAGSGYEVGRRRNAMVVAHVLAAVERRRFEREVLALHAVGTSIFSAEALRRVTT